MRVLIVESNLNLGENWASYLLGLGADVTLAATGDKASGYIRDAVFDVIVLNLILRDGSALAIADFAFFRQPEANVVFVTDATFFSDGSIFRHSGNARAFIESHTPPQDVAAIVHYYGAKSPAHAARQDQLVG